jgi:serine/threonine protein kinase
MSFEHVHALPKGVRLNQYELTGTLGSGGFGITYEAHDTSLDTTVAIKEYMPSDFAVRQDNSQVTAKSSTSKGDFDWGLSRFLEEARVLAKFRHPNIVRVNQIFEANNTAYLVMEYAKGNSLGEVLRREGTLSEQRTKEILFPILDGLKRVHELGFLHRDIKPDNIILRDEGGAVLIDFGAARQATETKSRAITSIVSEGYAPLEQYDPKGNQGPWTDIYAIGAVAYRCLTGEKPPAAASRVRSDPMVPVAIAAKSPVSNEFAAAIEQALHVFENQRPQSIAEFLDILSGKAPARAAYSDIGEPTRIMSAPPPIPAAPAPVDQPSARSASVKPAPQEPQPVKRLQPAYLGAAAAAVLVLAAGAWFYLRGPDASLSAAKGPAVAESIAKDTPAPAVPVPAPPPVPSETSAPPVAPPPVPAPPPARQADGGPNPPAVARPEPAEKPATEAPAAAPPPVILQASFDCTKAASAAERLICADRDLAALDVRAAVLYQQALTVVVDKNEFQGERQTWLAERDVCTDKTCLVTAYNNRIKELQRWVSP